MKRFMCFVLSIICLVLFMPSADFVSANDYETRKCEMMNDIIATYSIDPENLSYSYYIECPAVVAVYNQAVAQGQYEYDESHVYEVYRDEALRVCNLYVVTKEQRAIVHSKAYGQLEAVNTRSIRYTYLPVFRFNNSQNGTGVALKMIKFNGNTEHGRLGVSSLSETHDTVVPKVKDGAYNTTYYPNVATVSPETIIDIFNAYKECPSLYKLYDETYTTDGIFRAVEVAFTTRSQVELTNERFATADSEFKIEDDDFIYAARVPVDTDIWWQEEEPTWDSVIWTEQISEPNENPDEITDHTIRFKQDGTFSIDYVGRGSRTKESPVQIKYNDWTRGCDTEYILDIGTGAVTEQSGCHSYERNGYVFGTTLNGTYQFDRSNNRLWFKTLDGAELNVPECYNIIIGDYKYTIKVRDISEGRTLITKTPNIDGEISTVDIGEPDKDPTITHLLTQIESGQCTIEELEVMVSELQNEIRRLTSEYHYDVDNNGSVDMRDAVRLLRFLSEDPNLK